MSITKQMVDAILDGIHREHMALNAQDWEIAVGDETYTVNVKKVSGKVEYQVKRGRNIVAKFHMVMIEA